MALATAFGGRAVPSYRKDYRINILGPPLRPYIEFLEAENCIIAMARVKIRAEGGDPKPE